MKRFDAIIVGSGFGGSMAAHVLVNAGLSVLMLERGGWVERSPRPLAIEQSPYYTRETPYLSRTDAGTDWRGICACVGGPSVFYGGASLRLREADFAPNDAITGTSGAAWPLGYADLEPYYTHAELLLHVAGAGGDPTAPFRSLPYPQLPAPLSPLALRLAEAAARLGLHPFRLPLAINYSLNHTRQKCVRCNRCDLFPCPIEAKNDLATVVLRPLIAHGLKLRANLVVTRLVAEGARIRAVRCVDRSTGRVVTLESPRFVVAAGALGSPHLLLASGLDRACPAGSLIGRYLTRHCSAVVLGLFRDRPNPGGQFHKQIAIHDYYFGHPSVASPAGTLGSVQQIHVPPADVVGAYLPAPFRILAPTLAEHLAGLLVIGEDQPEYRNRLCLNWCRQDAFGLPQAVIDHRYSIRDRMVRKALVGRAKRVLQEAGALACYEHRIPTFSHALGTVRMGLDARTAPLDAFCRLRGLENLWVVDGSALPTSAGVNPSLTIAANALRAAEGIARYQGGAT